MVAVLGVAGALGRVHCRAPAGPCGGGPDLDAVRVGLGSPARRHGGRSGWVVRRRRDVPGPGGAGRHRPLRRGDAARGPRHGDAEPRYVRGVPHAGAHRGGAPAGQWRARPSLRIAPPGQRQFTVSPRIEPDQSDRARSPPAFGGRVPGAHVAGRRGRVRRHGVLRRGVGPQGARGPDHPGHRGRSAGARDRARGHRGGGRAGARTPFACAPGAECRPRRPACYGWRSAG